MRALVVLPLVPVTARIFRSFARISSRSGQSFRAQRPGMAVPPRCSRRESKRSRRQSRMAKKARIFMGCVPFQMIKDSMRHRLQKETLELLLYHGFAPMTIPALGENGRIGRAGE